MRGLFAIRPQLTPYVEMIMASLPHDYITVLEALWAQQSQATTGGHVSGHKAAEAIGMDWHVFSRVVDKLIREGLVDGAEEGKTVLHGDDGVFFVQGLTLAGRQALGV